MAKAQWRQAAEQRQSILDTQFRQACQERAAWEALGSQVRALVPKALEVLTDALDDPQHGPKVALAILKLAGLDGAAPPIPNRLLMELNSENYLMLSEPAGTNGAQPHE